jgi:hypothetical protein
MADVQSQLDVNDNNVRKWPTKIFFLLPPDADIKDHVWFDPATRHPILPDGALDLGYITTDGVSTEKSISAEGTQMEQSLDPVRHDLTGIEGTLTVAFGEDNPWVQALWHGKPYEDFATTKDGPWAFHDGDLSDFPYYRCGWLGQDGIGALARFRVEVAYRAKVTSQESRPATRTDPETYGMTFGLLKDPVIRRSFSRLQNGPAYLPVTP